MSLRRGCVCLAVRGIGDDRHGKEEFAVIGDANHAN